ncbi:lysyl oxidase 2 3 4 [Fusarium langsethiae]|uniref:Amine oxidase n=1 Tax=Fusarium langsethiae TaxID=179993 RepID=A0A0M9ETM2_FUSLA|nr:lysyl oxidase 2 3 4 [Fusarium langsethiae]
MSRQGDAQMPRSKEGYLWTPAGSTEGVLTLSVMPSTTNLRRSYDVVIIGAGFAGLVAARELSKIYRVEVLLIEARDRIGGRTWTSQEFGEDIEMGGTWVHWSQPHTFSELVRYGLDKNLKPTVASANPASTTHTFDTKPEEVPAGFAATLEKIAEAFFSIDGYSSRELLPYPHDPFREPCRWRTYDKMSAQERLDQLDFPQKEKDIFQANIGLFGLCSLQDASFFEILRWFALCGHSLQGVLECSSTFKLGKGGMTSFARAIFGDFKGDRLFNTEVSEIKQDGGFAQIITAGGQQISASVIISTIPLNCLADIKFSPPLSALRSEAVRHGHQNHGAKFHFKLRDVDPLWFKTVSMNHSSPYLIRFADHNGTHQASKGTFIVVASKSGSVPDPKDADRVVNDFTKTLRPGADVQAYMIHDWDADPYSKGAWSAWAPLAMTKYLQELQKPYGRVLFASADWANGWRGFIDGALESGKKAAKDAQTILRRSIPSHL